MRYNKGHSEQTRIRIVEIASAKFREEGLAALGIASVMNAAGLTHGGFYSHFESKEDLVRAAVLYGLGRRNGRLMESAQSGSGIEEIIRSYLSSRHRDTPSKGCTVSALAAEIARHSQATRDAFTEGLETFLNLLASHWLHGTEDERRTKAIALYGMMIGTLQLARATNNPALSDQILASGMQVALQYAQSN